MIYFYARVSSKDQNLSRQLEAAKGYKDVGEIFCDKQSGKNFERTEYQKMKEKLREGDEVVVSSLDRFGRNKEVTKQELKWFRDNKIVLRVLDLPTSLVDYPGQAWVGEMVNNILIEVMTSFAEQEREKINGRQKEGIAAMKAAGRWDEYGRPKKSIPNIKEYAERLASGATTISEICKELKISRNTWYRRVKEGE